MVAALVIGGVVSGPRSAHPLGWAVSLRKVHVLYIRRLFAAVRHLRQSATIDEVDFVARCSANLGFESRQSSVAAESLQRTHV